MYVISGLGRIAPGILEAFFRLINSVSTDEILKEITMTVLLE